MKLNHINLGVTDVPATIALLETYFGLRRVEGMPQTNGMSFVHDDNRALISLFRVNDASYPKIFHIGFLQDSSTSGGSNPSSALRIRDQLGLVMARV